ncbi:putative MFS family arabinose efflux permease [Streptomyces sp. 1114.5]|uniref:MFS transporter n=1 Tax=Streptomyces sp. 1114.5 TaxID=1938830 RepID=UPI000F27C558|nr:MFS transporter [Streptomyces sp. 1114.5]RKT19818.1 putative MFS family arabinose efflux permease [Streptomyces sp. 1114.5]
MSPPPNPPPPARLPEKGRNPLRRPAFRWFFAGRVVSVMGGTMTPVALAFAVLQLTGRPEDLSLVLTSAMVPMVALIILGGGVADRLRRDTLLRLTSLGSGLAQAAVALCVFTGRPIGYLMALAFVNGALQAFNGPAMSGIVPQLVDAESLQQANSLLATSRNAAAVLGPTLGGVLVATVGGGWAIAIDAASFFVCAACLTRVSLPDRAARPDGRLLHELRLGWTYFRSTSWIWSVTAAFTVINAVQMGVWQVLGPVIAKQGIGPGPWGAVLSAKAVGLLLMSAVLIKLTVRRPLVTGLVWMSVAAAPLILLGAGSDAWWLGVGAFVAGLGTGFMGVVWDTMRHQHIPPEMMSRATSYDDFGSFAAIPVGQLAVIPLATLFGTTRVALVGGLLLLVVALLPITLVSVRRLGVDAEPSDSPAPERAAVTGGSGG